jgi:hypothetical protein
MASWVGERGRDLTCLEEEALLIYSIKTIVNFENPTKFPKWTFKNLCMIHLIFNIWSVASQPQFSLQHVGWMDSEKGWRGSDMKKAIEA